MASEWKKVKIEDFADVKSGKRLPKGHTLTNIETLHPYIRLVDVAEGKIREENLQYLEPSTREFIKRYIVNESDVCLAIVGHTIGMVFYVDSKWDGVNLTENAARITNVDSNVNSKYLYYFLTSPQGKTEILSRKVGSAQGKLPLYNIRSLEVPLPPKNIQDNIAYILSSLDDKIELNRKMNETLEQMAQTLFKSWFVDFDPVIDNILLRNKKKMQASKEYPSPNLFQEEMDSSASEGSSSSGRSGDEGSIFNGIPEELRDRAERRCKVLSEKEKNSSLSTHNSSFKHLFPHEFTLTDELGHIPKGWEVSEIGNEVTIAGGATPTTKNPDFWDGGDIHWTTPKDLSGQQDKILLDTARKITPAGLKRISSGLLPIDTVLMSSRAPVGYLVLAKVPVAVNQGYIAMKCDKVLTSEFVIQWCESVMDDIKQRAGGTIFAEISKKNFRLIQLVVPAEKVVQKYSEIVANNYCKITTNYHDSQLLSKQRDILLLNLLSGEFTGVTNEN